MPPVSRPISLAWDDIRYSVPVKNRETGTVESKYLLNGVSGHACAGQLLCIMGSSGCGKTTLLNTIGGRLNGGELGGRLMLEGFAESEYHRVVKASSAYVLQQDIMLETLTPRELLTYQVKLWGHDVARVDQVISAVDLSSCEHVLIRSISGGQRKRVAIALELLRDPSILLLDEPTSGLDSYVAAKLLSLLRKMASEDKRTIVTTIHQPSSDMFAAFDMLLLMSQGRVVYFGKARDASEYFESIGFPVPDGYNPADHFLSVLSTNDAATLEANFASSGLSKKLVFCTDGAPICCNTSPSVPAQSKAVLHKKSVMAGTWTLAARETLASVRDPVTSGVKIVQAVMFAVVVGLLYVPLKDDQKSIQNRNGALFFVVINQTMSSIASVVLAFPRNKVVFLKEYRSGLYGVFSYYLAKGLADLAFQLISPAIFSVIAYFFVGFRVDVDRFFIFLACVLVTGQSAVSLGYGISALAKNGDIATSAMAGTMVISMLFGGLCMFPVFFLSLFQGLENCVWKSLNLLLTVC